MNTTPARFALVVGDWFDGETRRGPATLKVVDGCLAGVAEGDHGAALAEQGWPLTRGAFLMPGLVDAHVHLFLDGKPTEQAVRSAHLKQGLEALTEAARASARQNLACGVTLVRDAGDRHGINNTVRQEAIPPTSGLCHVRSGGLGVKRAKRYGAFMAQDVDDAQSITTSVRALAIAYELVERVGGRLLVMSAEHHDQLAALISHLPYAAAVALVRTVLAAGDDQAWEMASSGFRDSTRLAASDLDMMVDILTTNRGPVLRALAGYREQLDALDQAIQSGDADRIRQALTAAREKRAALFTA